MDPRKFDIEAAQSRSPTPLNKYRRILIKKAASPEEVRVIPLEHRSQRKGRAGSSSTTSLDERKVRTNVEKIEKSQGVSKLQAGESRGNKDNVERTHASAESENVPRPLFKHKTERRHNASVRRKSPESGGKKLGPSESAQRDANMRAPTSDSEKWRLAALRDEARLKEEKKREESARRAHKIRIAENMLRLEDEAKKRRNF